MIDKKMTSSEERERYEKEVEDLASALFWIESLLLLMLFVTSMFSDVIRPLLFFTTPLSLTFFLLCPQLSCAGPSGIGGFWLFLSDRFMFLLALNSQAEFFRRLFLFLFLLNHSVYIIEYLVTNYKPRNAVPLPQTPISTEVREISDEDEGDVSMEAEKTRELLKELREDGKRMDKEMEFVEQIFQSDIQTHRKNLSLKLFELRQELRDDGEKLMKNFVYSELATLRDDLRIHVDEIWEDAREELSFKVDDDIKDSGEEVKVVAEEVHETYFVIQETARAAKTTADRARMTHLFVQEIYKETQNRRWMLRNEDVEGLVELREEIRRMSLDFAARRMEAEVAASRAVEELSRATVELMEAAGIPRLEEYETD